MPARVMGVALVAWDKVNEMALGARPPLLPLLEVDAGRRIFEHKIRPPGITGMSAVAAVLEESQFRLQNFEKLLPVGHG